MTSDPSSGADKHAPARPQHQAALTNKHHDPAAGQEDSVLTLPQSLLSAHPVLMALVSLLSPPATDKGQGWCGGGAQARSTVLSHSPGHRVVGPGPAVLPPRGRPCASLASWERVSSRQFA